MLLSIIIPCYNNDWCVKETIESVKMISYNEWECIIIDDGSTDNSKQVIEQSINGDTRFKLITTENNGVAKARNLGMEMANGEYCMFLDSDDLIDSEYPLIAMRWMEKHKDCPLFFGGVKCVGIINEIMFPEWNGYDTILKEPSIFLTAIFKRKHALEIGGVDVNLEALEDYDFWVRYLYNNSENVKSVPIVMYTYRTRPNSRHFSFSNEQLATILKQINIKKQIIK